MRVISGSAKGTVLKTPTGYTTRPTADRVKEALFSILQFDLPAAVVLDLFGGTGQLGIEALSRGSKEAVFVDHNRTACQLIKENLSRAKLTDKAKVVCSDYLAYLNSTDKKFNIIFLDPPYAEVFLENSLKVISEIDILQSGGIIATERPVGKDLIWDSECYSRSKDYKYGKTIITLFVKE